MFSPGKLLLLLFHMGTLFLRFRRHFIRYPFPTLRTKQNRSRIQAATKNMGSFNPLKIQKLCLAGSVEFVIELLAYTLAVAGWSLAEYKRVFYIHNVCIGLCNIKYMESFGFMLCLPDKKPQTRH